MKTEKVTCTCPECFGVLLITKEFIFECAGCKALYLANANLAPYDIFIPDIAA